MSLSVTVVEAWAKAFVRLRAMPAKAAPPSRRAERRELFFSSSNTRVRSFSSMKSMSVSPLRSRFDRAVHAAGKEAATKDGAGHRVEVNDMQHLARRAVVGDGVRVRRHDGVAGEHRFRSSAGCGAQGGDLICVGDVRITQLRDEGADFARVIGLGCENAGCCGEIIFVR